MAKLTFDKDNWQSHNKWFTNHFYDSPEWSRSVVKDKDRGLGPVRHVDDGAADSVYQTEELPSETKKGRI